MLSDPKKERTEVDAGVARKSIVKTFFKKKIKIKIKCVKHPAKEATEKAQGSTKEGNINTGAGDAENNINNLYNSNK